jgi:hypothetical protein
MGDYCWLLDRSIDRLIVVDAVIVAVATQSLFYLPISVVLRGIIHKKTVIFSGIFSNGWKFLERIVGVQIFVISAPSFLEFSTAGALLIIQYRFEAYKSYVYSTKILCRPIKKEQNITLFSYICKKWQFCQSNGIEYLHYSWCP